MHQQAIHQSWDLQHDLHEVFRHDRISSEADRELRLLLSLPKAQISASLLILQDIAGRAIPIKGRAFGIERSPGYYAELPKGIARLLVPYLLKDALSGTALSVPKAKAAGFPIRQLSPESRGYGQHYSLPALSLTVARELIDGLKKAGHEAPEPTFQWVLGEALQNPVALHRRGRKNFIVCPEHDDNDPSALVNKDGSCWCFACNRMVGLIFQDGNGTGIYRPIMGSKQSEAYIGPNKEDLSEDNDGVVEEQKRAHSQHTGVDLLITKTPSNGPYSIAHVERVGWPGKSADQPHSKPTGLHFADPDEIGEVSDYSIQPQAIGLKTGKRMGDRPITKYGKHGMQEGYATSIDLLDALRSSWKRWERVTKDPERMLNKQAEAEMSLSTMSKSRYDHKHAVPDRYISVHWFKHENTRAIPLKNTRHAEAEILLPKDFSVVGGQWVFADLDGFTDGPSDDVALAQAGEKIRAWLEAHPCFSGRVGIVRTSHGGVHVAAQLGQARWDLHAFYADEHVRRMLAGFTSMALESVREAGFEGGHVDPCSYRAGQNMRRPGPRICKNGQYFISRLAYATP